MTQKQLSKLETRIATLKQANRIVWIEGISSDVIKGKIAGKQVFFVKADSLNANGGSWYYLVKWEQAGYECSCEYTGYKQCKHIPLVSDFNYAAYQCQFRKRIAEMKAEQQQASQPAVAAEDETVEVMVGNTKIVAARRNIQNAVAHHQWGIDVVAAVEGGKSEARYFEQKRALDEQYSKAPSAWELSETQASEMRHFYDAY